MDQKKALYDGHNWSNIRMSDISALLTRTLPITLSFDSWVNVSCWDETVLVFCSHDALEMVVLGIIEGLI